MWSYRCVILLIVSCTIISLTKGVPGGQNNIRLQEMYPGGYSIPTEESQLGRQVIVNLTDAVYKSALRFLRCCATQDNQHAIPLLDPLHFSWDRLADKQTVRLNGVINGTVLHLSQLNINHVILTVPSYFAKIIGNIPRLTIYGMYNASGALAQTLPVFGSGPYSVELYNMSVTITIALNMYQNSSFYMSKFDVEFSPKSIEVSLGQLLGGGALGSTVQDFLQASAPQILARARPMIQEDLRRTVTGAADRALAPLRGVVDLVRFLMTFGNVTTNTC